MKARIGLVISTSHVRFTGTCINVDIVSTQTIQAIKIVTLAKKYKNYALQGVVAQLTDFGCKQTVSKAIRYDTI